MNNKINIIVVDDSETLRQQVRVALEAAGFGVIEARDGLEGLAKIRSDKTARLVICDVNMPNMNGIEMVQAVHKDPAINHLPILMLTTEGERELVEQAKAAGAKAWVTKPFKPDLLVAAVKKLAGRA